MLKAPRSDSSTALLTQAILASIKSLNYKNAALLSRIFMERFPYNETLGFLCALSNYYLGKVRIAHQILSGYTRNKRSNFLFAKCCYHLELIADGISALKCVLADETASEDESFPVNLAEVYNLLGELHVAGGNHRESCVAFKKAVELNPFLLTSFHEYCNAALDIEANISKNTFKKERALKAFKDIRHKFKGADQVGKFKISGKEEDEKAYLQNSHSICASLDDTMEYLRDLGEAYIDIIEHNCDSAIHKYKKLLSKTPNGSWISSQIAYGYYEKADYMEAIECFKRAREYTRWTLSKMDIYASCLWHKAKDSELTCLSHELKYMDENAPETW